MYDYHSLLVNVIFLRSLLDLDRQVSRSVQVDRCQLCSSPLHQAAYPRLPRGVPAELVDAFSKRLSLCCGARDCRKRTTPPSVCFLGRRQYIAATFVLLSMLRHGVTKQRARQIHAEIPVDDRTLTRWRQWWRHELPLTPFRQAAAGRFARPVPAADLPAGLLVTFIGDAAKKMTALLRFLSALSTASYRSGSGLAMAF